MSLSWENVLYMSQVCDVCFYGFLLCNKNFRTFVKMFLKSSFFLFCLIILNILDVSTNTWMLNERFMKRGTLCEKRDRFHPVTSSPYASEIRPNGKSFSNLFKYFPHRHACITILLGLNQRTAFAMLQSKLNTVECRIQKPSSS